MLVKHRWRDPADVLTGCEVRAGELAVDLLPPNDEAVAESQDDRSAPHSSKSLWDHAEASF